MQADPLETASPCILKHTLSIPIFGAIRHVCQKLFVDFGALRAYTVIGINESHKWKRWYPLKRLTTVLMALTLAAALAATSLALTLSSELQLRTTLTQILIALSMAGLVLLAAFNGRRRGTETVGRDQVPSSRHTQQSCTFSDVAANEQASRA